MTISFIVMIFQLLVPRKRLQILKVFTLIVQKPFLRFANRLIINLVQSSFQDSDGEAGIALVGVHNDYPKFPNDEKYNDKDGAATVG